MPKIERKMMAHLIDANFGKEQPNWFRIGKDLDEFKVDLSPDVETKKNIIGETTVTHKGYEESAEVDHTTRTQKMQSSLNYRRLLMKDLQVMLVRHHTSRFICGKAMRPQVSLLTNKIAL